MLDEGVLAQAIDGYVKAIANNLQISPQRVHQIIANDPYASFMRIHRALAVVAPDRAEQIAVSFNTTNDGLLMKRELPSIESIISNMALNQGKTVASALSQVDVAQKLQEAFTAQRNIADYIETLLRQTAPAAGYSRPRAVGEKQ
jgi:predicted RNase H-like HicB family nuclease